MYGLLMALCLPPPVPPAIREFRGAWVATVSNIDWPSKPGLSVATQRNELDALIAAASRVRLNALIFQVRPSADAMYASKIEPWSEFLTGRQGAAPAGGWDPLAYLVQAAHRKGILVHAWFNPYRALHSSQKGPVSPSHISKTHPEVVKSYGTMLWMDPSESVVQQRSLAVVLDVVRRYDIDGVHIDDYFYPYPVRGSAKQIVPFPDDRSWSKYSRAGGRLSRGDWRRKSVDEFVKKLYTSIKSVKPWVLFGISPFGIYRPGTPKGIEAGIDQYSELYADARKWLSLGWCDYFTPQLYWKIQQAPQSYPVLMEWWAKQNKLGRHLYVGNFTSRLDKANGDWPANELIDQVKITQAFSGASGNVHFSMKALSRSYKQVDQLLAKGPYQACALPPAASWLDEEPCDAPTELRCDGNVVSWAANKERDFRFFAIYGFRNGKWSLMQLQDHASHRLEGGVEHVAISSIDRYGNESSLVTLKVGS